MYKDIIEIKETTPKEILEKIKSICIEAHKNRAGEVKLTPISEYSFCFQGTEKDYPCLQLGYLALDDSKLFLDNIRSWKWEDEDPSENCDLFIELTRPVFA